MTPISVACSPGRRGRSPRHARDRGVGPPSAALSRPHPRGTRRALSSRADGRQRPSPTGRRGGTLTDRQRRADLGTADRRPKPGAQSPSRRHLVGARLAVLADHGQLVPPTWPPAEGADSSLLYPASWRQPDPGHYPLRAILRRASPDAHDAGPTAGRCRRVCRSMVLRLACIRAPPAEAADLHDLHEPWPGTLRPCPRAEGATSPLRATRRRSIHRACPNRTMVRNSPARLLVQCPRRSSSMPSDPLRLKLLRRPARPAVAATGTVWPTCR
jgi:hypothetical protein